MWHGTDEKQHGQGRGAPMPGQAGRGIAMAMAMGIGMPYGPMPVQGLAWGIGYPQPAPPALPVTRLPTFGRGAQRPNLPLGVQGPGVLKRFGSPSQGPANRGRGYNRGYGGRGSGGRGHKVLTKEALDADLDQWRMKDKRSIGQFLDADLDEYWQKKDAESTETKSGNKVNGHMMTQKGDDGPEVLILEDSCVSEEDGSDEETGGIYIIIY